MAFMNTLHQEVRIGDGVSVCYQCTYVLSKHARSCKHPHICGILYSASTHDHASTGAFVDVQN